MIDQGIFSSSSLSNDINLVLSSSDFELLHRYILSSLGPIEIGGKRMRTWSGEFQLMRSTIVRAVPAEILHGQDGDEIAPIMLEIASTSRRTATFIFAQAIGTNAAARTKTYQDVPTVGNRPIELPDLTSYTATHEGAVEAVTMRFAYEPDILLDREGVPQLMRILEITPTVRAEEQEIERKYLVQFQCRTEVDKRHFAELLTRDPRFRDVQRFDLPPADALFPLQLQMSFDHLLDAIRSH